MKSGFENIEKAVWDKTSDVSMDFIMSFVVSERAEIVSTDGVVVDVKLDSGKRIISRFNIIKCLQLFIIISNQIQ